MDEKFESRLNDETKKSYEVKTTAGQILSAYEAKKEAKKAPSTKGWLIGGLSAFATAAVALAIFVPLYLKKSGVEPSSTLPINSSDFTDINVSPLKGQESTLTYEVTSLYPLLKQTKTLTSGGLQARRSLLYEKDSDEEEEAFEAAVDSYEKVQAPVRESFLGSNESLTVESGSFSGVKGTYQYKIVLTDVGTLLYNATSVNDVWTSLTGELSDEGEVLYALEGKSVTTNGYQGFHLTLTGEDGFYCTVEQDTTKGAFVFSYNVYSDYHLEMAFTIHLQQWQHVTPAVVVDYYFQDDAVAGVFRVLKESQDVYGIYGTRLSKILLTYKNNERVYTYNSFVKTED